jgi:hypothetical protein
VILSCVFAQDVPRNTDKSGQVWEYKVVLLTDIVDGKSQPQDQVAAMETRCNELGRDRWELSLQINRVVVFKRPKW